MKEISAGGIVFRKTDECIEILMIEDKYQKITIPKGKQEPGETLEQTALREIEEETGIIGRILHHIEKVHYQYTDPERGQIDKEVTYYLVQKTGGYVNVQIEEINQVHWMELEEALAAQKSKGYENNQEVFNKAYEFLRNS
ncbi:NUDIX hydrolase [Caldalkalibacillus mannanilyticus]|uniref:NUDIX hydrolase n=1 Tax=Caldalkalibacillus mannanilyticus TaxID=1418 RepID=UPI000468B598|nr:NUDIX domain-containing protein [Caldalkalibacillus mannanilyticus]